MTTTIARQARIRFAKETTPLAQIVINAKFAAIVAGLAAELELDTCQICYRDTAELYTRIDNRDGLECACCEDCADNGDVSWLAD